MGYFNRPTEVAIARNGDIFVADGHAWRFPARGSVKSTAAGKFLMAWGKKGSGPGEFDTPHRDRGPDSHERVYVADPPETAGSRCLTRNGKFIADWRQFRPAEWGLCGCK